MRHQPTATAMAARLRILPLACFLTLVSLALSCPAAEPEGVLDTAFGTEGRATLSIGTQDFLTGLVLQPDGRIVVCGYSLVGGRYTISLARFLEDGNLDTQGFNPQGIRPGVVNLALGSTLAQASGLALDGEGRILVAGRIDGMFSVLRLLPDGALDLAGFNPGGAIPGVYQAGLGASETALARAIHVLPEGRILATGYRTVSGNDHHLAAVRLLDNGTPDPGFGGGGVYQSSGLYSLRANASLALPDGGVLLGGNWYWPGSLDFALVRLTPEGLEDDSFGTFGHVFTELDGYSSIVALAPGAGGRVTAVGYCTKGETTGFAAASYLADGSLDREGFHPGGSQPGIVTFQMGGAMLAGAAAAAPGGKFLAAGQTDLFTPKRSYIMRFKSEGLTDQSFNPEGMIPSQALIEWAGDSSIAALAVRPDGKIVAGGWYVTGVSQTDFALCRLTGLNTAWLPALSLPLNGGPAGAGK